MQHKAFTPLEKTPSLRLGVKEKNRLFEKGLKPLLNFLRGFTLVEIMIVVAIIAVLGVLAVSNMLRARHNANEIVAIASCRNISTGCQNFYANSFPHTYPTSLNDLVPPTSEPAYIDDVLASGVKQGYTFTYTFIDAEHFTLNADPLYPGRTGTRHFYIDETGVLRANPTTQAGPDDPPVE